MTGRVRAAAWGAALATTALGGPPSAAAQRPPDAVAGRLTVSRAAGPAPVGGAWVVLHRVGPDTAGPLDSVRTSADGGFRFIVRPPLGEGALLFTAAVHHGIAYFSAPIRGPGRTDIVAFDTSSSGPPIVVRGRHVIVQAGGGPDRRAVVEVYDLENTGPATRVATAGPVFTAPLPEGAESPRAGRGDVAPEAVQFGPSGIAVRAPLAPGVRQVAISYTMPTRRFPLTFEVSRRTAVLEVLAEDSAATVDGAGLAAQEGVTVERRRFRRWLAQDVAAGTTLTVGGIGSAGSARTVTLAAAVVAALAALLVAVAVAANRRRASATAPSGLAAVGLAGLAAARPTSAEAVARRIADLDRAFANAHAGAAPSDEARAAYEAERGALKRELTRRLAGAADER